MEWRLHLTVDKRELRDLHKLPQATPFIYKTLGEMTAVALKELGTM